MLYVKTFENYTNDNLFKKLDFYYLKNDLTEIKVKEIYDMIENSKWRSIVTFPNNIQYFKDINATKVVLLNYPPIRFTKRNFISEIEQIINLNYIDEIEFPWDLKYLNWSIEEWREIILNLSNKGIKVRPMLEFGIWDIENIKNVIEFFKKINIMSIMTSSGLYQEMTNLEKWNEIKQYIPNKWSVKVGGVMTLNDIKEFLKNDIDLIATTLQIKEE